MRCLERMSAAGAIVARRLSAEQLGTMRARSEPCCLHTRMPFAATWQREHMHGRGSGGRICSGNAITRSRASPHPSADCVRCRHVLHYRRRTRSPRLLHAWDICGSAWFGNSAVLAHTFSWTVDVGWTVYRIVSFTRLFTHLLARSPRSLIKAQSIRTIACPTLYM